MKKQYPYSQDRDFLRKIDTQLNTEQWVKITLLEYNSENPLSSIEGEITSGTLNKDGSSAVRRTLSLNCNIDAFTYDPEDVKAQYSISKKVFLELGITNGTDQYTDHDIIWMPQGVFFITSFSISNSSSGTANISLNFKDKMAKLDGTLGGTLPATTRFDIVSSTINGVTTTDKVLVYDIIMEAVNHFGGESLNNIIIDDVPKKIKRVIRWMGTEPVWIYPIEDSGSGKVSYDICYNSDLDEKETGHTPIDKELRAKQYTQNQDVGYVYENFVYDDELSLNAGSKVTDVLDKIKTWLGNYEYFYDEYGQFHFQEIKNYLNNTYSSYIWDKLTDDSTEDFPLKDTTDEDYWFEDTQGKVVYTFNDSDNLVSITNTPSYENIKNDFIVEGTTTNDNIKTTVRYHLVIDNKPDMSTEGHYNILVYKDPDTEKYKLGYPTIIHPTKRSGGGYTWQLPEFGEAGEIYGLLEEPQIKTLKKRLETIPEIQKYYNSLVEDENSLIDNTNFCMTVFIRPYLVQALQDAAEDEMNASTTATKEAARDTIIALLNWYSSFDWATDWYTDKNYTDEFSLAGDTYKKIKKYWNMHLKECFTSDSQSVSTATDEALEAVKQDAYIICKMHECFPTTFPKKSIPDKAEDYYNAATTYKEKMREFIKPYIHFSETSNLTKAQKRVERIKWCKEQIDIAGRKNCRNSDLVDIYNKVLAMAEVELKKYERLASLNNTQQQEKKKIEAGKEKTTSDLKLIQRQMDLTTQRITALLATLTYYDPFGDSQTQTYVDVNLVAPAYVTSFWYYDTDDSKETYGWNELEWRSYYHAKEDAPTDENGNYLDYYHHGLAAMSYIDFNDANMWENCNYEAAGSMDRPFKTELDDTKQYLIIENSFFKFDDNSQTLVTGDGLGRFRLVTLSDISTTKDWQLSDSYPTMNRASKWYKNYFISYAQENSLYYIKDSEPNGYVPKDWRVELIVQGMEAQANGTDPGYYYEELAANWIDVYDFYNDYLIPSAIIEFDYATGTTDVVLDGGGGFSDTSLFAGMKWYPATLSEEVAHFYGDMSEGDIPGYTKIKGTKREYTNVNYHYFFDMIDAATSSTWGGYSVGSIGRRTNVDVSDSVNCTFAPETPAYAFINVTNMSTEERAEAIAELEGIAENIIQIGDTFYQNFATGGLKQSAYEQIKYDLQQYTSYQNTVSITARPSFYLEPNVRVFLNDQSTGTVGDYVLKTISIPLGSTGNNMSATLTKALEKI